MPICRVEGFLAGPLGDLDSEMARRVPEHTLGVCVCSARAPGKCAGPLGFFVCVHDEHFFALRAKFGNNCLGVRGVERWTD